MKAKKSEKPRIPKTYRLKEETVEQISLLADKKNLAPSEVVETLVDKQAKKVLK